MKHLIKIFIFISPTLQGHETFLMILLCLFSPKIPRHTKTTNLNSHPTYSLTYGGRTDIFPPGNGPLR